MGTTAGIRDLEAVNESDCRRIGVLTSIAVLAVLVVVLRRPLVSLYLVLTVLLGFFVSMGVTKLVFMRLYGGSFHGLDWKLPLFLFVILVAVGEDYNIYLATRVVEEQRRRGAIGGSAGGGGPHRRHHHQLRRHHGRHLRLDDDRHASRACTSWASPWPSACSWTRS